jgi:hypothetical protein
MRREEAPMEDVIDGENAQAAPTVIDRIASFIFWLFIALVCNL